MSELYLDDERYLRIPGKLVEAETRWPTSAACR